MNPIHRNQVHPAVAVHLELFVSTDPIAVAPARALGDHWTRRRERLCVDAPIGAHASAWLNSSVQPLLVRQDRNLGGERE